MWGVHRKCHSLVSAYNQADCRLFPGQIDTNTPPTPIRACFTLLIRFRSEVQNQGQGCHYRVRFIQHLFSDSSYFNIFTSALIDLESAAGAYFAMQFAVIKLTDYRGCVWWVAEWHTWQNSIWIVLGCIDTHDQESQLTRCACKPPRGFGIHEGNFSNDFPNADITAA